jgi:hypothetical protein
MVHRESVGCLSPLFLGEELVDRGEHHATGGDR